MSAIESATVLNGRYHVLRPVGRGGMGAVYEAIDLRLRNTVAVKKMTAEGPEARRAFEREARLLAALRHRALPVVIDYFIEDESCFLVMQFIEGEDLAARVRRGGACAEKEVQRWAAEVLAALVYLHGLDSPVVHRDIKPANLKLTPRGDVVLLDFGLAKGQPETESRAADDDQSIYGFTPNYAPPEQLQFQRTDARSDLYALGATLYHLVAGAAPPSAVDRSAAVGLGHPDPLTVTSAATVSAPFAAVLRRAMALDPAARFASAADMLSALPSPSPGEETEPARLHGLVASPPPLRPSTRARRLDAATPSRAELGRPVDLLVQVRFADSPLLGLEDWPTRRKPDRIEQTSEPVRIEHAVDPSTGRFLPARLRITLVAPDFEIRGAGEQLIDVTPDEYSQRVAFLMTPRRIGYCRVNVEVYSADTVYLGALAIEPEVVPEGVRQGPLCTADLVLNVTAREQGQSAPAAAAAIHNVGAESTVIGLSPPPRPSLASDADDITAAIPASPVSIPAPASAAAQASPDFRSAPAAVPAPSSSRLRPLTLALSAAAVLMMAVLVQQSLNTSTQLTAPPVPQPSQPSDTQAAAPPSAGGGAPPSPAATPTPAPPQPTTTVRPAPPAAPPRPAERPVRPSATVAAPPASAANSSSPRAPFAAIASASHPGVTFQITTIERAGPGVIQLRVAITNRSSAEVSVGLDQSKTRLADARGVTYRLLTASGGMDAAAAIAPGQSLVQIFDFAVPDETAGTLQLTLAPARSDAARFPAIPVVMPGR